MRGTQSLLSLCADCWKRPALLGLEMAWRWAFGIPSLLLAAYLFRPIFTSASASLAGLSFSDPVQAGQQVATVASALMPDVARVLRWLTPALVVLWSIASGLGRTALLRRLDPTLRSRPVTLILLQLLRMAVVLGTFLGWYRALQWAANVTLDSASQNVVGWCAFVICLSLGVFVLWALVGWIFSIAPLVAMLKDKGVLASLASSVRLGSLTAKLVEVNLVLGIVRLALIVLAMVFSAIPLPFVTDPGSMGLYLWWALGTVLYLIAGDFFQVVRLAAFIQFWRMP